MRKTPPYITLQEAPSSPPLAPLNGGSAAQPTEKSRWFTANRLALPSARAACELRSSSTSSVPDEQSFKLADGTPTPTYGRVEFEKPRVRPPAWYIRVSHETDVLKLVEFVSGRWKVPEPKVIISITGAAQGFRMQPHVHEVVNEGLVRAAKQTSAWLVTGGTDTGVMKLVGEAVRKADVDIPLFAIAPWGAVHGREQLESEHVQLSLIHI